MKQHTAARNVPQKCKAHPDPGDGGDSHGGGSSGGGVGDGSGRSDGDDDRGWWLVVVAAAVFLVGIVVLMVRTPYPSCAPSSRPGMSAITSPRPVAPTPCQSSGVAIGSMFADVGQ